MPKFDPKKHVDTTDPQLWRDASDFLLVANQIFLANTRGPHSPVPWERIAIAAKQQATYLRRLQAEAKAQAEGHERQD